MINWLVMGGTVQDFSVELVNGGTPGELIADSVQKDQFTWRISQNLKRGGNYQIVVRSLAEPSLSGTSALFYIN